MLFKDVETFHIVYRQYEFNTEAMDGLLERVNDVDLCLLLEHTPNANWTYSVDVAREGYSDILWEEFSNKITERPETPEFFMSLILKKDLDAYVERNKYTLIKRPEPEILNVKEKKVITNVKLPTKSTFNKDVKEMMQSFVDDFKLARDAESLIYKFKSPNSR